MERLAVAVRLAKLRQYAVGLTPSGTSPLRLQHGALNAREELNRKANAIIAVGGHLGTTDPSLRLAPDLKEKFDAVDGVLKRNIAPGPQSIEIRREILQSALACVAAQRNGRSPRKPLDKIVGHGFSDADALDLVKSVRSLGDDLDKRLEEKRSFFAGGQYENVDGIRSLEDLGRVMDRQTLDERQIFGDVLSLDARTKRRGREQDGRNDPADGNDVMPPNRRGRVRNGEPGNFSIYSDASRPAQDGEEIETRDDKALAPSNPERLNREQRARFDQWVASLGKTSVSNDRDDRYDDRSRSMGGRSG